MRSIRHHTKGTEDTMTKEIPLTQGKTALVDDEDYLLVSPFKWSAAQRRTWYAVRIDHKKMIYLHRFLLGIPSEFQCDHINGDGLDNRRCNLRIATNAQNQWNRHKRQIHSSSFRGVTWDKNRNRWIVYITANKKTHYLGRYINETDAAKAYDEAAKRLFGEYANLNF